MGYERDTDRQELAEIADQITALKRQERVLRQQRQRVLTRIRMRRYRVEGREGARKAKT